MSDEENKEQSAAGSLMSHLVELRDRVVRMVISILVFFLGMFYWANDIYIYLAEPLTRHMPEGGNMIAIDVASIPEWSQTRECWKSITTSAGSCGG